MKIQLVKFSLKTMAILGTGAIGLLSLALPTKARAILESSFPDQDFSNFRNTPTSIGVLDPGLNRLEFVLDNPNPIGSNLNRDLDYFTLSIPEGFLFSDLIITGYTPQLTGGVVGSDQIAFIALQRGIVFTEPPQPSDPATGQSVSTIPSNLLGYTLIGSTVAANALAPGVVNAPLTPFDRLLPAMGATTGRPNQPNGNPSPAPAGFVSPLGAGNYVFWVQQTASGAATIQLNFLIEPIPEPGSALAVAAVGGMGLLLRRNRG